MNNNYKKKFAFVMGVLLVIAGCGKNNNETTTSSSNFTTPESTTPEVNTPEITTPEATTTSSVTSSFTFPNVEEFITPNAYANASTENWEYHAKVEDKTLYIYVVQNVSSVNEGTEVDLSKSHILVKSSIGDFTLCSNGAYKVENAQGAETDYHVDLANNKTKYYFKATVSSIEESVSVTFYSFDTSINDLADKTKLVDVNGVKYKTHFIDKLYVKDRIGFKPESLYETNEQFCSPIPSKWGYAMQSSKEGIYMYIYHNVDEVKYGTSNNDKWKKDTHVELSIYHHSFGYGATHGFLGETYAAIWLDKSYYINDQRNVLGVDTSSTVVSENRVEYRFFIRFNNNLDNPQDGPYAFIRPRLFDPTDNLNPYNDDDCIEYRDDRFVHSIRGDSLFVYDSITHIDNPYENAYLESRLNKWQSKGFANTKDVTLFIGDSFFEDDNWWVNFYNDFSGKACFTSAIGGTKVTQWLNWIPTLVAPFAENLKNIVIHLGYNDVNMSQIPATQLEKLLERLFTLLHEAYPEANIYYFGIGMSSWFVASNKVTARETDKLTKEYDKTCDYLTYIDMDEVYNQYIEETGGTLDSFFNDRTHPKNENYKYLINALVEAGCVIADK